MFSKKNRNEKGYVADYLNNFERRKRLMNKIKSLVIILFLFSYGYLLYDNLNRRMEDALAEEIGFNIPCQISVQMAKDSVHLQYSNLIDSVLANPREFIKRRKK